MGCRSVNDGVIGDWMGAPLTLDSGDRFIAAGDSRPQDQALKVLTAS